VNPLRCESSSLIDTMLQVVPSLPQRYSQTRVKGSPGRVSDGAGLCKVATLTEIEAQGWSLNSGRYVGVAERAAGDLELAVRLEGLNEVAKTVGDPAGTFILGIASKRCPCERIFW